MKKNNIEKGVCRISSSLPIPLPSFPEPRTPNPESRPVGLYLHIPFCAARCNYCDFFTFAGKENLLNDYVQALCNELATISREHDVAVKTIFFGGGTPSILGPSHFDKIFNALHKNFTIQPGAEITVECNPGTLNTEKVHCLKSCGVNRVSLGVQSFNDETLKFLGRIHISRQVVENYDLLRETGFSNINMDFISAVPGNRFEDWESTLKKAVCLSPEHISAYSFILEEETKFYELHLKGKLNLLDEDEELRQYEFTREFLTQHGYHHYEISNFARPGFECRHNLTYWKNEDYLGAGASACSLMGDMRWENARDLKVYIAGSDPDNIEGYRGSGGQGVKGEKKGKSEQTTRNPCLRAARPHRQAEPGTRNSQIADTLMMGLRLTKGISLNEFRDRFGVSLESLHGKTIQKFEELGLLEIQSDYLRFTPEGLLLSNEVLRELI